MIIFKSESDKKGSEWSSLMIFSENSQNFLGLIERDREKKC